MGMAGGLDMFLPHGQPMVLTHKRRAKYGLALFNVHFRATTAKGASRLATVCPLMTQTGQTSYEDAATHLCHYTVIPITVATIVLRHGGAKITVFGIHGTTAGAMLNKCGLLLFS